MKKMFNVPTVLHLTSHTAGRNFHYYRLKQSQRAAAVWHNKQTRHVRRTVKMTKMKLQKPSHSTQHRAHTLSIAIAAFFKRYLTT